VLFLARVALALQFQAVGSAGPFLIAALAIDYASIGLLIGLHSLPGVAIAIPGGVIGQRFGAKQVALLGLAMMALGVGKPPALVALFLHALLPIVRNTVEGLQQLPPAELECARGMGMTPSQTLTMVELPEALPIIAQGIRVALVINVGVAPLAFLVGGGGLGDLIFSGIDLFEPAMMLAGAIPTAALAVVLDFLLSRLTRLLVSPGIRNDDATVAQL